MSKKALVSVAVALALAAGAAQARAAPNASGWSIQPTANVTDASFSELNGVSCLSSRDCTAVGYDTTSAGSRPLIERWDGLSWQIQPVAAPAGGLNGFLLAVSCTSPVDCTAVGQQGSANALTLIEHWNGSSWEIQSSPTPTGASFSTLQGVSCTTPRACTAVGWYSNNAGTFGFAELWNGTSWELQPVPNPDASTETLLAGVSCATADACTAVGLDPQGTLAERWDGSAWEIQPTPNPPGPLFGSELVGVSCPTPRACTAVGRAHNFATLAERWDGSTWALQATPNPTGSTANNFLGGVSCASPQSCTAAGYYFPSGGVGLNVKTLAEHWNGTSWEIQPTPNPAGMALSGFFAVSCPTQLACAAVGGTGADLNSLAPLAEGFSGKP